MWTHMLTSINNSRMISLTGTSNGRMGKLPFLSRSITSFFSFLDTRSLCIVLADLEQTRLAGLKLSRIHLPLPPECRC